MVVCAEAGFTFFFGKKKSSARYQFALSLKLPHCTPKKYRFIYYNRGQTSMAEPDGCVLAIACTWRFCTNILSTFSFKKPSSSTPTPHARKATVKPSESQYSTPAAARTNNGQFIVLAASVIRLVLS
jgi:hypothetical protein